MFSGTQPTPQQRLCIKKEFKEIKARYSSFVFCTPKIYYSNLEAFLFLPSCVCVGGGGVIVEIVNPTCCLKESISLDLRWAASGMKGTVSPDF
jgi:hypothetical protein